MAGRISRELSWYRDAVIYQVYPRSFADGDGDGIGDIAGLRSRLPYLAGLGIDAIWIGPWYPSPMADAGYDVADYRSVDPLFGTLADGEALVANAHDYGLRVILDIVPNHTSDQHPWFREALAAGPGSRSRERYVFRSGQGVEGELPPNDWQSMFGGPAWTRVIEQDGRPGEWYLHLFAPEQPDLNWTNPDVRADFEDTLRFWFDRGVDGFRIDVANALIKQDGLPDIGARPEGAGYLPHPHWDRDEVHEVYRAWRKIADSYTPPRVFVAEAWVDGPERLARYVRGDELHTAFNFDYLTAPWLAPQLRATITAILEEHASVGAPPTWVLSNHDVVRHPSRFGYPQVAGRGWSFDDLPSDPADLELGTRRARAATLLMLALPGSAYLYQGEELGLPEVADLPEDALRDPTWLRSGHTRRGRDGCRVPLPWGGQRPPYGFSAQGGAQPWLPQPVDWAGYTVEHEEALPSSMLRFYRAVLGLRRELPALGDGALSWIDSPAGVLAFTREPGFTCMVNISDEATPLPDHDTVLIASADLDDPAQLPPDTTVWITGPSTA
jgi:alpha-glucosidase